MNIKFVLKNNGLFPVFLKIFVYGEMGSLFIREGVWKFSQGSEKGIGSLFQEEVVS